MPQSAVQTAWDLYQCSALFMSPGPWLLLGGWTELCTSVISRLEIPSTSVPSRPLNVPNLKLLLDSTLLAISKQSYFYFGIMTSTRNCFPQIPVPYLQVCLYLHPLPVSFSLGSATRALFSRARRAHVNLF